MVCLPVSLIVLLFVSRSVNVTQRRLYKLEFKLLVSDEFVWFFFWLHQPIEMCLGVKVLLHDRTAALPLAAV